MNRKKEEMTLVEVGTLGDICAPAMLRIHAFKGVETGKFYGVQINHCISGDCYKPRTIMFKDIDTLVQIAESFSNEQEPLNSF